MRLFFFQIIFDGIVLYSDKLYCIDRVDCLRRARAIKRQFNFPYHSKVVVSVKTDVFEK